MQGYPQNWLQQKGMDSMLFTIWIKKYVEWTNLLFHPNIMSTLIRAAAKRSVQALQLISLRQLWVK